MDAQTQNTEHLGIALSGGLDARTVLGLTDHERVKLTCYSLGMEGSLDVNSARRLARLRVIPITSARWMRTSSETSPGIWNAWWN